MTEQSCTQQGGVYTQTRDTRTCTTTTTGEYARMGRVWTSYWLFTPSDTHYAEYEIWRATTTTTVTSTTGRTTSSATSTSYSYLQPDEGKSCFEYDTEERGTLYRQDPSECEALGLYDEWERHIPRHRDALALIVDSTNGGWAD